MISAALGITLCEMKYVDSSFGSAMLAGIAAVSEDDDVMLITNTGMIIRTRASEISVYSRTATGVRVMRLGDENMKIVSFTRVDKQEQAEENAEEAGLGSGNLHPRCIDHQRLDG